MGRYRVLALLAFVLCAVTSFATDWRLVIASDDPGTRLAPAIVVFEGTGKLNKEDRITSITFSAGADVKPNCLVSLDPASGKAALALSPDVKVYQGKVMIAGSKPSRKVIPAYLMVDVPVASGKKEGQLGSVMTPIIQQVNNLPWVYIAFGVGIFMAVMYLMNRRTQQYSTSMSKEAKNLYLETVGRITDRLERIEVNQDRLVKNPPVVRTFKAQIEDFEGRLGRIEKLAKEGKDEFGKAALELGQSQKRHDDLVGKIDSSTSEAAKAQAALKQEADALRAEMKLLLKSQDEAAAKLIGFDHLKTSAEQIAEQNRQLEARLIAQDEAIAKAQAEHKSQLLQVHSELAIIRTNQESLASMPRDLELVTASLGTFPAEFESVRSSMPRLDGIEAKLDSIAAFEPMVGRFDEVSRKLDALPEFGSKLDKLDESSQKLDALSEIKNSLEAMPSQFPRVDDELARIHESLLLQIESLTGRVDQSGNHLGELISAHKLVSPEVVLQEAEPISEYKKGKKGKHVKKEEALEDVVSESSEEADIECSAEAVDLQVDAVLETVEPEPEQVAISDLAPAPDLLGEAEAFIDINDSDACPKIADKSPSLQVEESLRDASEPVIAGADLAELEPDTIVHDLVVEPEVLAHEQAISEEDAAAEAVEEQVAKVVEESEAILAVEEFIELQVDDAIAVTGSADSDHPIEIIEATEDNLSPSSTELEYRYPQNDTPVIPEFHFNNAAKKMAEEEKLVMLKDEAHKAGKEAPLSFHLDPLPDHLDTFEDAGPDATLTILHVDPLEPIGADSDKAVELVLKDLKPTQTATNEVEAFDGEHDEDGDAHMGHWSGLGGSSTRSWSSQSSRPLDLIPFEGELKPLTPIETAPTGDTIGSMVYGYGRVVYGCGSNVHGFWPGRDDRHVAMDVPLPTEEWRLALKGQNLFSAESKKVKILSIQGWFVLEQFSGEYHDQLVTDNRWVGLRHDNGAVLDFRDFRGQMSAEGIRLDIEPEGSQLCAGDHRVFAASRDGRVVEASEFGTELLGRGPQGGELMSLSVYEDSPLAVFKVGDNLECWHFGPQTRSVSLELPYYSGKPVILGSKLYLADLDKSELVSLNLKKMQRTTLSAFSGVGSIRRMIGVQHKSQHDLFAITSDDGKKGGRLIMIDAKTGRETTFGSVGQANVNLIVADHYLVLSTSSQYQNVIRVLEPFAQKIAA